MRSEIVYRRKGVLLDHDIGIIECSVRQDIQEMAVLVVAQPNLDLARSSSQVAKGSQCISACCQQNLLDSLASTQWSVSVDRKLGQQINKSRVFRQDNLGFRCP
jgi:hypothetical protein